MKKYSYLLFIALAINVLSFNACKEEAKKEKAVIATENVATASLKIEGMTCEMGCAKMIESSLAAMEGIGTCQVNFEEAMATVEYDKTVTDEGAVVGAITSINDGQYKVVKD